MNKVNLNNCNNKVKLIIKNKIILLERNMKWGESENDLKDAN